MRNDQRSGISRRQTLECMAWAGGGLVWTLAGGVPKSRLISSASAAESGFSFIQISDSHIGFDKAANPDAKATLKEAVDKILAMPSKPAFMIHTGDITHSAKPQQFDDANELLRGARLDIHYSPGEHDITDPSTHKVYLERYGAGSAGGGWYSFDQGGVHFVSLVNVVDLKTNGLGYLGAEQLQWLDARPARPLGIHPDRRVCSYSLVDDRSRVGLGHRRRRAGPANACTIWIRHRPEWPYPPADAEDRGVGDVPHRSLHCVSPTGSGNRACARS